MKPFLHIGRLLLLSSVVGLVWLPSVQADTNEASAKQSLLSIYHQALENDPVLKSALSQNKAAQELIEQGKALYRPQVDITAGVRATAINIDFVGRDVFGSAGRSSFEGYQYGISARQPLYRKQSLVHREQTKTQVSLADKRYHLAQQQLMLKVTSAYFDVLNAQDNIALLAAQKSAIQSQLAQAKANFDVGNANITDYHEAQARYDLVEAKEIAAKNTYEVALYSIQALTNQRPAALATVKADIATQSLAQAMQDWVDVGLKNNLAIQMQQDALTIAGQEVEKKKAGRYPTVDAVASYAKSYENGGNFGFGMDLNSAVIGVQMAIPIYRGGAIASKTRQAIFNQEKAQDDVEIAKRNTVLATQQAYLNLSSTIAQISALEQALKSTQSQLDSTQVGYDVGVRTSVDLLNAQQLMFSAKRDLLKARYNYLVNIIRLKTVTGQVAEADLADINQQLNHE